MSATNSLISGTKASDSGLHASLHPLVLLTISDYITRHSLRRQSQPIIGALLGQQKGREITIEHAFDLKLLDPTLPVPGAFDGKADGEEGEQSEWRLHEDWFLERLQQYKDVHKDPPLELVGWWTVASPNGPGPEVLGIHRHFLKKFNETALLLAFHPESVRKQQETSTQGRGGQSMPLTIYESVNESRASDENADEMQVDVEGGDKTLGSKMEIKLRELPYEIVTGEAEMIAVDFVAKGSGNASAVENSHVKFGKEAGKSEAAGSRGKGKGKALETPAREMNDSTIEGASPLNPEEEELVTFLSSRANAIKMLQSRLSLLKSYLQSLPPSYLTDPSLPAGALPSSNQNTTTNTAPDPASPYASTTAQISHPTLRSLQALTSRLPLLTPADPSSFAADQAAERSDVAIVGLLGSLGRSVSEAKELGRTFYVVDGGRNAGKKADRWGGIGEGRGATRGEGTMDVDDPVFQDRILGLDELGAMAEGLRGSGDGWMS